MNEDLMTKTAQGTGAATAVLGAMTWQEWAIAVGIVCTVITTVSAVLRNRAQQKAAEAKVRQAERSE